MDNVNKLTNKELEALSLLAEECGEVIQVIGKILRHGLNSNWEGSLTNRELLEIEVGDMFLAAGITSALMLDFNAIQRRTEAKPEKLRKFLHYIDLDEVMNEG